jgi:hypothetical protein
MRLTRGARLRLERRRVRRHFWSEEEKPLTVIRSGAPRRLTALGRLLLGGVLLGRMLMGPVLMGVGAATMLAACSTNTNRAVTPTVGVDTGVALETAGSVTSILVAEDLNLAASVENPSDTSGVRWTITGNGTLTSITNASATYVAPNTATGAVTALITATSVANPTQYASVTIIVNGTPVNNTPSLFPANVNVPYAGEVSVAGGETPFTWTLLSGTLPPGLTLGGSTSGVDTFSGTPTAQGTYTFVLQASDTLSRLAEVSVTLTVNPEAACLLNGNYTFRFSGYRGGGAATHTGAIAIDGATGTITGIQDYKDTHRTSSAETLTSGTCTIREDNSGTIKLVAPSGTLVYNFAATPPDSAGVIHSAALQLISSGSDSGSGELDLQDASAITASPPSGNFAFGLLGVNSAAVNFGTAGRLTSDTSGNLSAGLIDSNDIGSPLTAATLTGTLSAPDVNGRGTLTLATGSKTSTLAYYLVNATKLWLMDIDATSGTPIESGQMTAQVGDVGPGAFDNNAMATPSILSLFGASGVVEPVTEMGLGRLSNANPAAGTLDALLDLSEQAADVAGEVFTGQSYAVETSGRGTLTLQSSAGQAAYAFYLDGTSNGYIVEQGSISGDAGFLEAQFQGPYPNAPPSGTFPDTLPNEFVSITAYPQSHGPVTLQTLIVLNYGSISSSYENGAFSIDPTSGRGIGTLSTSGIGSNPSALYIVSPTKIDVLKFGTRGLDGSIDFMTQQ